MATPETIGTATCPNCATLVYVKKNRGGLPYFRCGKCDHEGREHSAYGARLFLAKVTRGEFEEESAPTPGKPDEKPAATPTPVAPEKPAKRGFSTLLGG